MPLEILNIAAIPNARGSSLMQPQRKCHVCWCPWTFMVWCRQVGITLSINLIKLDAVIFTAFHMHLVSQNALHAWHMGQRLTCLGVPAVLTDVKSSLCFILHNNLCAFMLWNVNSRCFWGNAMFVYSVFVLTACSSVFLSILFGSILHTNQIGTHTHLSAHTLCASWKNTSNTTKPSAIWLWYNIRKAVKTRTD